jgi:hypothetical protein
MENATDWKNFVADKAAAKAVEVKLPSGMTIKARRPGPMQLALWGRLPFSLTAVVAGGNGEASRTAQETAAEVSKFLRNLLLHCCVYPRISLDPHGEGEILPTDIDDEDLSFIVQWAMRTEESSDLESFRGKRTDVGGRGNGKDVGSAPVEPAAN